MSGIYWPKPISVTAGSDGVPLALGGKAVETVREDWVVEDRWWTPKPLSRRYFEVVLADGRCVVVFCEPAPDGTEPSPAPHWFEQRA